jgi:hypothetical protein
MDVPHDDEGQKFYEMNTSDNEHVVIMKSDNSTYLNAIDCLYKWFMLACSVDLQCKNRQD